MHRWWEFTPPVWCEFGGFSRYNFYSAGNMHRSLAILRYSSAPLVMSPMAFLGPTWKR